MEDKYSIRTLFERYKANWPETATPESEAALSLIRFNDLGVMKAKEIFASFGLTHASFEVLVTLRSLPEPRKLTPTELYKSILITSGGMTKVLKSLEDGGHIERLDNPEDKRSKFVCLTEEGVRLAEEAMLAVNEGDKAFFQSALEVGELEQLNSLLRRALSRLEK